MQVATSSANAAANAAAATHLTAMNVNSVRRALAAFLSGLMPPKLHTTAGGFVDLVLTRGQQGPGLPLQVQLCCGAPLEMLLPFRRHILLIHH